MTKAIQGVRNQLQEESVWRVSFVASLFIVVAFIGNSSDASLQTFTDRASWRAAAGGGAGDLTENFNAFGADVLYNATPVVAGFLTLSTDTGAGDSSWRIDALPARFPARIPDVNGTTFATSLAAGSIGNTILSHAPLAAIGFDFGKSADLFGTTVIETSLGDFTSYTNTSTTGGFFGIVYDAGETFTSLNWRTTIEFVYSGIDDVEAYSQIVPEPISLIVWSLLGCVVVSVDSQRRKRFAMGD